MFVMRARAVLSQKGKVLSMKEPPRVMSSQHPQSFCQNDPTGLRSTLNVLLICVDLRFDPQAEAV